MPNGGVQPIGDAGVVGAGDSGHSIALALALGGFPVVLVDSSSRNLQRAMEKIRTVTDELEGRGAVHESVAKMALELIRTSVSIGEKMRQVGFAVEAVPEDLELKRRILADLDRHCPPRAVLASTSSSYSAGDFAEATGRPDRVVVTRWGCPPHRIPRVEVAGGPQTSERTIAITRRVLEYIGKEPVVFPLDGDSAGE